LYHGERERWHHKMIGLICRARRILPGAHRKGHMAPRAKPRRAQASYCLQ